MSAKVLKAADKRGRRFGAAAVNAWDEVVGPEIAAHTRGFALREDKELVVLVDSSAWANQLSLMSMDILGRLNTHLGNESVKSLRFTVSRDAKKEHVITPVGVTEQVTVADSTPPIALDHVESAQAESVAAVVKNEALREAALKAMVKDLEQKKGERLTSGNRPPKKARPKGR
jgi:hypothetical protein